MRYYIRAVAGLMAVAWALPAVVGRPPGQPTSAGPGLPALTGPAKPPLKVRVFKLERGDPEAVVASLNSLLEGQNAEVVPPMGLTPVPPGGLGVTGIGGIGGMPPGGVGFGGMPPAGVIGCFIGNGGMNQTPVWRATAQARTRAVVVRGSDRHLTVAADLVALLDRPANAPLPRLHAVKAFALKHATAEELEEVIDALSFGDVRLATPGERLLLLVAPDEVGRAVAELVTELDVPGHQDQNPAPKKGPGPDEAKPPR